MLAALAQCQCCRCRRLTCKDGQGHQVALHLANRIGGARRLRRACAVLLARLPQHVHGLAVVHDTRAAACTVQGGCAIGSPPEEAPPPGHLPHRQVVLPTDVEVRHAHQAVGGQVRDGLVNDAVEGRNHCSGERVKRGTGRLLRVHNTRLLRIFECWRLSSAFHANACSHALATHS